MATVKALNRADQVLMPNAPREKYRRRTGEEKKAVAWKHLNMILGTTHFLNTFWDPQKVPHPIIVSVGSAPSKHIAFVAQLYPEMEFHLYDVVPHAINQKQSNEAGGRIHLYHEKFTDEIASQWANRGDVFFISDFKTGDYKKLDPKIIEEIVWGDMRIQQNWVTIINPVQASLNFRLPYVTDDPPGSGNYPDVQADYLDGIALFQPWTPPTSTETRLVPIRNERGTFFTRKWSALEYQEQTFYHNVVTREMITFTNPYTGERPFDPPELLTDFDSIFEITILRDYLFKRTGQEPSADDIKALSLGMTQYINEQSKTPLSRHILRTTGKPHKMVVRRP